MRHNHMTKMLILELRIVSSPLSIQSISKNIFDHLLLLHAHKAVAVCLEVFHVF